MAIPRPKQQQQQQQPVFIHQHNNLCKIMKAPVPDSLLVDHHLLCYALEEALSFIKHRVVANG
jgi:hypothetical protein